jgi:hypothetical protein
MSIYQHNPPFTRGQVLGVNWKHPIENPTGAYLPDAGLSSLGSTHVFTDVNPATGRVLSNEIVTCIAVKNAAQPGTTPLAPCSTQTAYGYTGIVDEYLPKVVGTGATAIGGVPAGEIYWLVVAGPFTNGAGVRQRIPFTTAAAAPVTRLLPDGTEEEVTEVIPSVETKDATTDVTAPDATAPTTP